MKIWKLTRKDRVDYDQVTGFVIVAATAARARDLACMNAGTEGPAPWASAATVACESVGTAGPRTREGIVLSAYRNG